MKHFEHPASSSYHPSGHFETIIHYVPASAGFLNAVDIQLMEAANIASCPEYEENILLIMDEMHLKESLVFNKHTGALVGFTNLGEMNKHLQKFKQSLGGNTQEPLAK